MKKKFKELEDYEQITKEEFENDKTGLAIEHFEEDNLPPIYLRLIKKK